MGHRYSDLEACLSWTCEPLRATSSQPSSFSLRMTSLLDTEKDYTYWYTPDNEKRKIE